MAILYFDSSALVKLVVEEEGSAIASVLWDAADAVAASPLAHVEVRAALAAGARDNRLSTDDLSVAELSWAELWAAVRVVGLSDQIADEAGEFAARHALRGADAVHLTSALALGPDAVHVVAWDRRLRAGAESAGLPVAPVTL